MSEAFHNHLDGCIQCRLQPFNLCAKGKKLHELYNQHSLAVTLDFNGDSIYIRDEGSDQMIDIVKLTSPKQVRDMKRFMEEFLNRIEGRVVVLEEVDEDTTTSVNEWDFR